MAVIQTGGGGGILGTLGKIAGLGGMVIPGAQWLTPLGIGMGAADSVIGERAYYDPAHIASGPATKAGFNGNRNHRERLETPDHPQ